MRLDKYISEARGITRSEARSFIALGAVSINNSVVKKVSIQVESSADIMLQGQSLSHSKFIYIMLNKPKGVVSASKDKADVTVADLVSTEYPRRKLFPAGRLDKTSTGFVLITDDGVFAHDILSPKHHVHKVYEVVIDAQLTDEMIKGFENGVTLADQTKLSRAKVEYYKEEQNVRVTLYQGVYHQIKRMFGVYGVGVNELRRVEIGGVKLDDSLPLGGYRLLTAKELENIKGCIK